MNRITLQDRVKLFDLQTIWSILSILGRNVTRCTWLARFFVLSTFQNHLNSISFLCHLTFFCVTSRGGRSLFHVSFFLCFLQTGRNSFLVDCSQRRGGNLQSHILILFRNIEFFGNQVRKKLSFRLTLRVRNIVPSHYRFTCDLTNSRHLLFFITYTKSGCKETIIFSNAQVNPNFFQYLFLGFHNARGSVQ